MTELEHYELNKKVVEEALSLEYPEDAFSGRGIVTCGGGETYFVPAYIMIRVLRELGCTLPVQIWYLGDDEIDDQMRGFAAELENVELVDATKIRNPHFPMRKLGGWECKVFSIVNCPFEEVMFIDADNIPTCNPEFLFKTPKYKDTGAVFWPDFGRLEPKRKIWEICGVEYRDEPEFESGQMVVDKRRCWDALCVTSHLNSYSDFYYQHRDNHKLGYIWGDKDTFHMGWRMVGREYTMVPKPIKRIPKTMVQHDLRGTPIFQHRNMAKFSLTRTNPIIPGFEHEERCLEILDELRDRWVFKQVPRDRNPYYYDEPMARMYDLVVARSHFSLHRLGRDKRTVTLLPDFKIGRGQTRAENRWRLEKTATGVHLLIEGDAPALDLRYQGGNHWSGNAVTGVMRVHLKSVRG